MKKLASRLWFVTLIVLFSLQASAQHVSNVHGHPDLKKIKYHYYTSFFSVKEHIPILVTYTLTRNMVSCGGGNKIKRTNRFKADPEFRDETSLQKNYTHSGYDRGHNMSAADNACDSIGMAECFYFSNMTPQPHSFNAGVWEDLENLERTDAEEHETIIVSIGSVGKASSIGEDEVVVPKYMWKVIFIPQTGNYDCYIFADADGDERPYTKYQTTLEHIEELAGLSFKDGKAALK